MESSVARWWVISSAVFDDGHEIQMICNRDEAFCFVLQIVVYPSSAHGMLDEAESKGGF